MTDRDRAEHHRTWDLLPWLINGTLEGEEAAAARAHVASCEECARELERQTFLAELVAEADVPVPSQAYALEDISHRLADNGPGAGLRAFFGRFGGASAQGLMLGGALAAAVLLGVFALAPDGGPFGEDRFETVTDPVDAAADVEIRLRFEAGVDPEEIRRLLTEAGASDLRGPSETGLMRAALSPEIADDAIERLRGDPRILFIASDD